MSRSTPITYPKTIIGSPTLMVIAIYANVTSNTLLRSARFLKNTKTWKNWEAKRND